MLLLVIPCKALVKLFPLQMRRHDVVYRQGAWSIYEGEFHNNMISKGCRGRFKWEQPVDFLKSYIRRSRMEAEKA
jgi:hypothetical protein